MKVLQQSHKFYIQHCQAGVIPSVCGQIYAFKFAAGYFRSVAVHFIGPAEIKRKLVDTTAFSSDSAGSWCVVFGYRTLSPQTRISVRTFFSPPRSKNDGSCDLSSPGQIHHQTGANDSSEAGCSFYWQRVSEIPPSVRDSYGISPN